MERTWREAIIRVLREAQNPLEYAEIAERILTGGYYETDGATPRATVNAQITGSIKREGSASPFVKVGRGLFGLKEMAKADPVTVQPVLTRPSTDIAVTEAEVENSDSIIRSFGMYWQRDLVVWRGDPRLFGKQQAMAKPVDFSKQKGIYILYDHHTVVYIGRSIDRPVGRRLYEHTIDRLGSRWNRFSWFGLLDVTPEGDLRELPLVASLASMIGTLEALLIESLEPPQNRKRGDDFSAVEYIQDVDPELREREIQNTLRSIEQKMRGGS
ncbi:HTH domain-containing protein [Nitrosospira sp. Is2]|uniref:HTH domain-containing protein n=1 Tax=Nitrosospira sp. Is2 TaxID=3080532 RepID=UPI002954E708|nr:HTH domain-containing protein [Nitrosospira sp. Is2]WON72892.1 HTH domain-containing protein [Nitrosospira sp. Is2]